MIRALSMILLLLLFLLVLVIHALPSPRPVSRSPPERLPEVGAARDLRQCSDGGGQ